MGILELLIKDFQAQGEYIPRAVLLAVLFMAGYIWLLGDSRDRWKPGRLLAHWRLGLFVLYLSFLLVSTVFGRMTVKMSPNLWNHLWFRKNTAWNNQIIENILLFIPYTVLFLTAFRPRRPFRAALLVSLCTTVGIELSQLLCRVGDFQVSDILYNTLGGLAGWGIWTLIRRFAGRKRHGGYGFIDRQ